VTGACFVMGQAAGTAAALALQADCSLFDLDIKKLQDRLTQHGTYLGGRES
jgi:hypothetical protein